MARFDMSRLVDFGERTLVSVAAHLQVTPLTAAPQSGRHRLRLEPTYSGMHVVMRSHTC
jgi:hypothetical protein